jgi:asparagine synthase (glutamine-hydrolysing)
MCGIFGAIALNKPFPADTLSSFQHACEIIAHRGPDAQDYVTYSSRPAAEGEFDVFLGHRRLAILDLDPSSNQPFRRDNLTMIYNGEVFNYLELRAQYLSDVHFDTHSDTEVILRLYQKMGPKCFSLFNGMWALMIYDHDEKKVVVSRDRFSIKPIYHYQHEGAHYFASEIKQLKQLKTARFTPNVAVIKAFLNQSLLDYNQETFYNEITKFPAMSYMEIDLVSGQMATGQYWNFSFLTGEKIHYDNPQTYFRELLLDALKLRLRSDVPVGTLLSGGLDSSAITCLIRDHINPDIQSFSVVSSNKNYSEEQYIDLLVKKKGIRNEKLNFENNLALDHLDEVLGIQDEPYGSLAVVAQKLLFEKIKKETGITVLLSGQGADEILMGYNKFYFFHLKQLLKHGRLIEFTKQFAGSAISRTTLWEFNLKEAKRYLPGRTNSGRDFFTCSFENEQLWQVTSLNERQILDITKYSIPALTHYEDRNSMASSIEVRLPFLDYRLVDFLVDLPAEFKLKNGWSKSILRESIHELPDEIRWRRDKKGFVTPEEEWMKGEFGAYIIDFMKNSRHLEGLQILDTTKFIDSVHQFKKGNKWVSYGDIFRVFITEKWLSSQFGDLHV